MLSVLLLNTDEGIVGVRSEKVKFFISYFISFVYKLT